MNRMPRLDFRSGSELAHELVATQELSRGVRNAMFQRGLYGAFFVRVNRDDSPKTIVFYQWSTLQPYTC